jgi:hypothetical protein
VVSTASVSSFGFQRALLEKCNDATLLRGAFTFNPDAMNIYRYHWESLPE